MVLSTIITIIISIVVVVVVLPVVVVVVVIVVVVVVIVVVVVPVVVVVVIVVVLVVVVVVVVVIVVVIVVVVVVVVIVVVVVVSLLLLLLLLILLLLLLIQYNITTVPRNTKKLFKNSSVSVSAKGFYKEQGMIEFMCETLNMRKDSLDRGSWKMTNFMRENLTAAIRGRCQVTKVHCMTSRFHTRRQTNRWM